MQEGDKSEFGFSSDLFRILALPICYITEQSTEETDLLWYISIAVFNVSFLHFFAKQEKHVCADCVSIMLH